jgi:hypothetical protein
LGGVVVTADAMRCQKAHADYLVLQRGAHYILTVKQPAHAAQRGIPRPSPQRDVGLSGWRDGGHAPT